MSSKQPDTSKAAKIQADASKEAALIQAQSERESRALQEKLFGEQQGYLREQDQYNQGLTKQNQENYNPYIQAGQTALGSLSGAIGDPNSWLNKTFTADDMQNEGGYQFRLAEGQNSLNQSLAARGGLLSGAAVKAASQYGQGMASDEYNNAYQRFTNDRNNQYNQLNNMAGMGLSGASGFAGGSAQSTTGTQMSNIAGQFGQNMTNIISNGANSQANNKLALAQQQAQYALQGSGPSRGAGFLSGAAGGAMTGAAGGLPGMLAGGIIGGLSSLL